MIEKKLQEFLSNWQKKNPDSSKYAHNVYHLETRDRDGNITGEAFGLNVVTALQMSTQFSTNYPSAIGSIQNEPNRVYVGNGCSPSRLPKATDVRMFSLLCEGTTRSDNNSTVYDDRNCIWDPIEETLYFQMYLLEGRVDYEMPGIETSVEINEIGVSNNRSESYSVNTRNDENHLSLHAAVYDIYGDLSSITKNPYEELYIKIYVTVAMKPQYVHNSLVGTHTAFAMDPWAYVMTYRTNWNRCCMTHYGEAYIRSAVNDSESNSESMKSGKFLMLCYRGGTCYRNSNSFFTSSTMPVVSESLWGLPLIAEQHLTCDGTGTEDPPGSGNIDRESRLSTIMEDKSWYVDLFWMGGRNYDSTASAPGSDKLGRVYYLNIMAMTAPIRLSFPDTMTDLIMFVNGVNDSSITHNFGYKPEDGLSQRGQYPFVDFSPSVIKAYNGLSHTWDIAETIINSQNNFLLTEEFLYPWMKVRMHTEILDLGGNCKMLIWFNNWPEHPITSFDRTLDIYATDAWWDPSTWVRISDCSNVPAELGSKTYFLTKFIDEGVGFKPPLVVTRSNVTKPGIQMESTVTLQNKDQASYTPPSVNTYSNPICGGIPTRRHIACDSKGYIWMSNTIYYPDDDVSYPIQTTESLSNINQPAPSMRYTEPSGKRILQIFRANNAPANGDTLVGFSPRLSKVSVFDISSDPTVPPHEYLITLPGTFSDNYTFSSASKRTYITSTENGHVVFTRDNSTDNIFVINILGDANSNYEPYAYKVQNPVTGDDLITADCWAVKYTNYIVYKVRDAEYTSDDDWLFRIQDLTDDTIYQEFRVPKTYVSGETTVSMDNIRWIRGWKNFIYLVYTSSSSSMRVAFYDMNNPSDGVRVITENQRITRAMMPGGSYFSDDENIRAWYSLTESHTYGDEHCFLIYNVYYTHAGGDNAKLAMNIYYVDEDNPIEFLNINKFTLPYGDLYSYRYAYTTANGNRGTGINVYWYGVNMDVCTYNQGKQRLLIINPTGSAQYHLGDITRPVYVDLNYVRDYRTYFEHINARYMNTLYYPLDETYDKNNVGKYCAVMYKGKVVLSEYDTSLETLGRNAILTVFDPNRVMPHVVNGSTYTIQCYNDPRKIYCVKDVCIKYINDATRWAPN